MINVLLIGENSYIGVNIKSHLEKIDGYKVETISARNNVWTSFDFSPFQVIIHLAAIVHCKESACSEFEYVDVNHILPLRIAEKAKSSGVKQFIFLSSMSVYGLNSGEINDTTETNPTTLYGKTKLLAEKDLGLICGDSFKLAIVRPPMVYGFGCKGNYNTLKKFSKTTRIFPDFQNKRSMIYIENLCAFIKLLIDNSDSGIFCPQNNEYVSTSDMVGSIAQVHCRSIFFTKAFNVPIKLLRKRISLIEKVFGDLTYDKRLSNYDGLDYNVVDFSESIRRTEEGFQ